MPVVNLTISDVTQSVIRPTIIDIVGQVKALTHIRDDVPIFFGNDTGKLQTAGSGLGNTDDRFARFDGMKRVTVTVEENYAEDQHLTDFVGVRNNIPVFADRLLGVEVSPIYATSTVNIRFRFETRSKEEARRWRDDAAMKYLQLRTSSLHQINYSYTLPTPVWRLLKEIWTKRESLAGYGDRFGEYIDKCMTNRLTVVGNETASQCSLVVTEKQDRIQGFFDFTTNPERPEYNEDKGNWSIGFTYTYTYQRPAGVDLRYPISVHNQFLADDFIDYVGQEPTSSDRVAQRDQWSNDMSPHETDTIMDILKPRFPYIRIPEIDDYNITHTFPGTGTFMLTLLSFEDTANKTAYNLRELGDITLDEDVLQFIQGVEYRFIGRPGKSIIHADVYRATGPLTAPSVTVTKELDVLVNPDIDLRKQYRIRFSLFCDLSMLDKDALDRLRLYPRAFVKIIGAINELIWRDSDFQKLVDQTFVYPWQLEKIKDIINGGGGNSNLPWDRENWLNTIPPHLLEIYRRNRKAHMTVMSLGTIVTNNARIGVP